MDVRKRKAQNNTEWAEKWWAKNLWFLPLGTPEESFNNPENPLWKGKTADDALFNIAANYLFTGFEVVHGHYCYDVYHNKHIKEDLENYPAYLQKVFNIK